MNEAVKHPSGGRTYRGRAGECPRTFAGFVGPRGDICPRREYMGEWRPVNEAVKHPSGGRTYRGRAGECPRTFAGFVCPRSDIDPGRGFGLAKDAVRGWLKRFWTEKTIPPREQIWQGSDQLMGRSPQRRENLQRKSRRMPTYLRGIRGPMQLHWSENPRRGRKPVNEAVKHPSGGRTYRGRANECPRTFAGSVCPRSDIGPLPHGTSGGQ